ncbi:MULTISPECIES: fructosamine kinase family protein [Aeromicrobium]|uniref:fructosamine kinase family protein n=1 Tax=Aeromicrobium TaxID=2040 RepID=UPI0006F2BB22|nr:MULTISPECIES: fructosamine kinase family protein [Aeromicrobium]KQX74002.1 fructosamine kinase [Aeromicrobium sp. Root472D3]MCL8250810.1 fructosamine kinase family protein [Aeromicrobium fastidiosum]
MARMAGTAARAETLLGIGVVSTTPVAGGDICTATRLRLTDGRGAIIKTRPHAPEGFFRREAEGLHWLADAQGARVPQVLAVADDCLVLDWIEPGKPTTDLAEKFGRSLAATHRAGADAFGGPRDGFVGLAPLPNRTLPSWPEFFASRRVMPYVRAAVDRGSLTTDEAATIEAAMRRIHDLAGPDEAPSRIHGDLWSGNVVWGADGDVWIIDPAAHGGHRETDLAMLSLFGAPHLQRILDAYDEAAPLADGWHDRLPLHQLHPLLVHSVLFGGTYGARAAAAARDLLAG